jgi:diacylglycerol kinase (ATP)
VRPRNKTVLAITGPRSSAEQVVPFRNAVSGCAVELLDHPDFDTVRTALATKPDCALLFGGDGTLNRYLDLLLEAQAPVLMVPTGSGNDFAMANGVRNAADALAVFKAWGKGSAETRMVDIAEVALCNALGAGQRKHFSCCVNIGVDAEAVYRANRLPNWLKARGGYLIGTLLALIEFRPQSYTIVTDAKASEKLWFIAGLNTPTYGGGLKIAPHASIIDRRLELALCGGVSPFTLLRYIPRLFSGRVHDIPFLHFHTVERFRVKTATPQPVCADGEVLGFTPIEVTFAARLLPVIVLPR